MKKTIKELEILDCILNDLKETNGKNYLKFDQIRWPNYKLLETSPSNKRLVMDKLVRDKYVIENDLEGPSTYFITFEGLFFINKGGYIQQNKDNICKRRVETISFYVLVLGFLISSVFYIISSLRK